MLNGAGTLERVVLKLAVAIAKPGGVVVNPPDTVTGLPSCVLPLRNVTVPEGGVPKLWVATVAVSVTKPPAGITLGLEVTMVVVVACVIFIVSAAGPLGPKLLSPE